MLNITDMMQYTYSSKKKKSSQVFLFFNIFGENDKVFEIHQTLMVAFPAQPLVGQGTMYTVYVCKSEHENIKTNGLNRVHVSLLSLLGWSIGWSVGKPFAFPSFTARFPCHCTGPTARDYFCRLSGLVFEWPYILFELSTIQNSYILIWETQEKR